MKKVSALLLSLALILHLAACSPGGVQAVVVRYGMSNGWDSLMPYNSPSGSNYSRIIYDKIYDRLVYVHADGALDPRAADSWEGTDSGYGVVFHLNQEAAFHDGVPVTAQSWVDTIALLTDPECPALGRSAFAVLAGTDENGAALAGEALGAEALDGYTLKLTFKVPTIPEEFLLDKNREYYVLPTHLLEGTAPAEIMALGLWDAPIGSGPCKFVSEIAGSELVLAANPDYQLGKPGFDKLIINVVDKSNLLTSLIAGDLDYYAFGGSVSVEDAQVARSAGISVLEGVTPTTFYELMLNNGSLPDARVRRAIELALDKESLCLQSTQGLGMVTNSDVLGTADSWVRDVEGAEALLAEGGYDGRTLHLACISSRAGLAALMQQNLAEAGINVVIDTVDSATLFSGMAEGVYDMAIASHTPGALPLWFTESRLTESNNIFHVGDLAPYERCLSTIKAETDAEAKAALVGQFQQLLREERPFIPLWFGTALHAQSPTVGGIDYPSSSFCNENVWEWEYHSDKKVS